MNILQILQKNKHRVQTALLIMLVLSPVFMFIGIQNNLIPLVYLGLGIIVLANIAAALTK
jgi:hypothetical protein